MHDFFFYARYTQNSRDFVNNLRRVLVGSKRHAQLYHRHVRDDRISSSKIISMLQCYKHDILTNSIMVIAKYYVFNIIF